MARKPGARAEFDWSEVPYPTTIAGTAAVIEQSGSAFAGVKAVLWVPDPEQRRGWREVYVRDQPTDHPSRPVGFRR